MTHGLDWNHDPTTAPVGTTRYASRLGRGGVERNIGTFVPERIFVAFLDKGGERCVSFTYRTEPTKQHPTGWWSGLHSEQVIYAWAPMPEAPEVTS